MTLSNHLPCPCNANQHYHKCCAIIHQAPQLAHTAEQLMRARYSAFALDNTDFIINTYHSSCNAALERQDISQTSDLEWLKLEIIPTTANVQGKDTDYVEFKAWYKRDNQLQLHHELSRFVKEKVEDVWYWRYIDGEFIDEQQLSTATARSQNPQSSTISRNAPCPCNSGKKYKRCCLSQ